MEKIYLIQSKIPVLKAGCCSGATFCASVEKDSEFSVGKKLTELSFFDSLSPVAGLDPLKTFGVVLLKLPKRLVVGAAPVPKVNFDVNWVAEFPPNTFVLPAVVVVVVDAVAGAVIDLALRAGAVLPKVLELNKPEREKVNGLNSNVQIQL